MVSQAVGTGAKGTIGFSESPGITKVPSYPVIAAKSAVEPESVSMTSGSVHQEHCVPWKARLAIISA